MTAPRCILEDGEWLWRVSWHGGWAYGISYRLESAEEWTVSLLASRDGLEYTRICRLEVPGRPNEATVRVREDGRMIALVRREGMGGAGGDVDRSGWIGASRPPYTDWRWHPAGHRLGGPNFLVLPDGSMWAAGRGYRDEGHRTVIARLEPESYEPVLELPSGGDCSYPGLAWWDGRLWASYYSSHEGKACIYLAEVRLR